MPEVVKLRHHIKIFAIGYIYLLAALVVGIIGWYLQHIAFTPPPAAGQMYAVLFVRDPAAHVSLSTNVYPDTPWNDSLTIKVGQVPPAERGWLLLVECPGIAAPGSRVVHLTSETAPQSPQAQSVATSVTAYSGLTKPPGTINFHCFPSPHTPAGPLGAPAYPPSLANVSLAALQLDDGIVSAQAAPVLYAQQSRPGAPVSQLVQVFPGAVCPSRTPTAVPTTSASVTASASATASASSPASAAPPASAGPTASASSSPSPSPQGSVPASPACLNLAPAGSTFVPYQLPASVATTEALHHLNTKGYQISTFPVGTTGVEKGSPGQAAEESITWSALSSLNPSLDATNYAAEAAANHDIFIAGVLLGLAGGAAVESVDHLWTALRGKKGKRPGITL